MMKIIFALALLSSTLFCASAQRPQIYVHEVEAAFVEFYSEAVIFTETDIEASYIIGEYDWVVTHNKDGEVELSVHTVPASEATDLDGALTELFERLGEVLLAEADEIEIELDGLIGSEEDVDDIQKTDATAANIRQFGSELQANASQFSAYIAQGYNDVATIYTGNVDNIDSIAISKIQKAGNNNDREATLKLITELESVRDQLNSETAAPATNATTSTTVVPAIDETDSNTATPATDATNSAV